MTTKRAKFDRGGPLALSASALGLEFDLPNIVGAAPFTPMGTTAVVDIDGPLTNHSALLWESYDGIRQRAAAAFSSASESVVLRIDSPGGDAAGCFELARELRAMSEATGKPLYAHVDHMAASAAYAIACAAQKIVVTSTAQVGSVGIVLALVDQTEMDKAAGLNFAVITSGARKADHCPHVAISEDAKAAAQNEVDSLAALFFSVVADSRGITPDDVKALEAGVFRGARAVESRLADEVGTFRELLGTISGVTATALDEGSEGEAMTLDEIISGLKKLAEGDGDDADKAKKLLGNLEGKPADEAPAAAADDKKADDDDEEARKRKKLLDEAKDKAEAAASLGLARRVQELEAKMAADADAQARAALFAERPDFTPEVVEVLRKAPLATLRDAVKTFARVNVPDAAAPSKVHATRGAGQGTEATNGYRPVMLPPNEKRELDQSMGLASASGGVRREGNKMVFSALPGGNVGAAKGVAK